MIQYSLVFGYILRASWSAPNSWIPEVFGVLNVVVSQEGASCSPHLCFFLPSMPRDPSSNVGSSSRLHTPYPSSSTAQDGWIAVPRPIPGSWNTAARFPPQQPSGTVSFGQTGSTLAIEHPFGQLPSSNSQVLFGEIPGCTPSDSSQ